MRIFFIGNSYTLYNSVHEQVASLAREASCPLSIGSALVGGASLKCHYEREGVLSSLKSFSPTHLVLQEKSTGPLFAPQRFEKFVAKFSEHARELNARVLLYETWARHPQHHIYRWGFPWVGHAPVDMQARLTTQYKKCAQSIGAQVAPVGQAWSAFLQNHVGQDIPLHDLDRHHAAAAGGHLAARVLFSTLNICRSTPLEFRPKGVSVSQRNVLSSVADTTCRRNGLLLPD